MKLRQISANDPITNQLLSRVEMYSLLLSNVIEFYTKPGNAGTSRKEQGNNAAKTRALESSYEETLVRPAYETATRKFIGDTVKIDVAYQKMGYDISSEVISQLLRSAAGIAHRFADSFINGDADDNPKNFNGLKKMVTAAQTVKADTNGLALATGNSNTSTSKRDSFLEKLDETIALCSGMNKVIVLNPHILARLNTYAREYIQYTADSFGRKIASYNGIPLYNIDEATAGGIIPFSEATGTARNTASLYVVSCEEEAGVSFLTTPDGFSVYPMEKVDNWYKTNYELIADSILLRDKAISRLQGLKLG